MNRRSFITLFGGAAVAWPRGARAQQAERVRLIGIVAGFAEAEMQPRLAALRDKLRELGWTEGGNLSIDTRLGRGDFKRMKDDAGLLVAMTRDGTVGRSDATERSLPFHRDIDPV
jgi:hypothetical protein